MQRTRYQVSEREARSVLAAVRKQFLYAVGANYGPQLCRHRSQHPRHGRSMWQSRRVADALGLRSVT